MSFNALLTLLLILGILYTAQNQGVLTEDYIQLVNNNIPEPTHIQVEPQTFHIYSEATIPKIIESPSIIFPLYYSQIQNKTNQNCTIQPIATQKNIGDYIKFEKGEMGKFEGWPIEILDGAYSFEQQLMYAILTNGSIIIAPLRKNIQKENNVNQFQVFNYVKTQSQKIWQLDEYELYINAGQLYLLKDRQLFKAVFLQESRWEIKSIQDAKDITRVYQQKEDLYFVKSKSIHRLQNGTVSSNLLNSSPEDDQARDLIDMSIDNGYMYLLCRNEGILLMNEANNYELIQKYKFDFQENAYRITVKNNTVLLNFKIFRKTYIGQFFLIHSSKVSYAPVLKLNKFYYRFDSMDKVVLFEDFGIVYSLSQMNFFQHSINRYAPFGELETNQVYRATYPKILDVIPLDEKNLQYILVEKNGIFIQSFGNQQSRSFLGTQMRCVFQQAGTYEVSVSYQGFCKKYKNPTQAFCSKINTYKFQVTNQKVNRQAQTFNSHLFMILILTLCLILVIGAILAYRRYTIERQRKLYAQLQRRTEKKNQSKSVDDGKQLKEN